MGGALRMAKPKKLKVDRGMDDLRERLHEQVGLLQLACSAYDDGKRDAAKFMAVTLRLLLHQTHVSHALLDQLGLRQIRFSEWNYAGYRNRLNAPPGDWSVEFGGLVGEGPNSKSAKLIMPTTSSCRLAVAFNSGDSAEYVAPLSTLGREIRKRFPQWWNDEVVRDMKERKLCRKDIVLEIANTDGGAHVDPQLEERYLEFSRKNSLKWGFSRNGLDWEAIPAPHLSCMRQIAHETLVTLTRAVPWAFKQPYAFTDPLAGREGFSIGSVSLQVNTS